MKPSNTHKVKSVERNMLRLLYLFLDASHAKNVREMTFHFGELDEYNEKRIALQSKAVSK